MDLAGSDGLHLALRWFHVVAVITWVGHAFFFNWLDRGLRPVAAEREGETIEGELWMVHSGGFYRVEKIHVAPERLPAELHWFRWEAAFSGLSGLALLFVVYYLGGGALLVDPGGDTSVGAARATGLAVLAGGWLLYDLLWATPFGASRLAPWAGYALVVLLAFGLPFAMSGRAAYIHVGSLLGVIMVANVWRRIIPAQRALVAASREGRAPDPALGLAAKTRSLHNNYLALPVVFIMISNHFWGTYGHEHAWAVLALLVLAGAGLRHLMNLRLSGARPSGAVAGLVVAAVLGTAWVTRAPDGDDGGGSIAAVGDRRVDDGVMTGSTATRAEPGAGDGDLVTPGVGDATGIVRGTVRLEGAPPPPRALRLLSECQGLHAGEVMQDRVLVDDGRLADAFVWISGGTEGMRVPPPPSAPVVIDQVGCFYVPRIVGVRVRQPLTVLNSDPLLHNVHAVPDKNREFNLGMPPGAAPIERVFKRPEVMVPLKCDIHPWMGAFLGVVEHPWFGVTPAEGAYRLEGLPPGRYELSVWHEVLGELRQRVDVEAEGETVVDLVFRSG